MSGGHAHRTVGSACMGRIDAVMLSRLSPAASVANVNSRCSMRWWPAGRRLALEHVNGVATVHDAVAHALDARQCSSQGCCTR